MDTQTLELIGRHRLASDLLLAGLEVAFPARDRGIDLIAYLDVDKQLGRFVARPIQMKAASRCSFGIWKKYSKIHGLIVAFVWFIDGSEEPQTFALTCEEAIAIGRRMGSTKTSSWREGGRYITNKPSPKLCALLKPHRMTPELWWKKITGAGSAKKATP